MSQAKKAASLPLSTDEKPKRRRRTSELARREILDAAGRQLVKDGPDGLKLQSIAADLGISHSSILHHFGSRDQLLDALSIDAMQGLERDLKTSLETPVAGDPALDLFDKIAQVLGERGHAQLLAWQILSGRGPAALDPTQADISTEGAHGAGILNRLAQTVHPMRLEQAQDLGRPLPELDETRRLVALTACAVFGEALTGDLMLFSAGLGRSADARQTFRNSIAKIIEAQVFPPNENAATDSDPT